MDWTFSEKMTAVNMALKDDKQTADIYESITTIEELGQTATPHGMGVLYKLTVTFEDGTRWIFPWLVLAEKLQQYRNSGLVVPTPTLLVPR